MKNREWTKDENEEDGEEEEEEEGECFSVDSLENGKVGRTKFNNTKFNIYTVSDG